MFPSVFVHKMFYCLLKCAFRAIRKHKFVFVNSMPKVESNAIFAVNHSCMHDIPYVCEAIGKQCYVLIAKQPLKLVEKIAININGAVWVDRKGKESRKKSAEVMVGLLKKKANILIFPESTWNITPSAPVLPLYWGVIDVARRASVPIVPVVLEFTSDKCYISFGSPIKVSSTDDKKTKIADLTDALATQKWELWERFPCLGYDSQGEWDKEIQRRWAEYPKADLAYERSCIRGLVDVNEVYSHLSNIEPNGDNAFLFSKRNHN